MTAPDLTQLSTDDVTMMAWAETLRGLGAILSCLSSFPESRGRKIERWARLATELERRVLDSSQFERCEKCDVVLVDGYIAFECGGRDECPHMPHG